MTLKQLQDAYLAGEAVVKVDEAQPWLLCKVSRATFYRSMAAGEVPGVLRLGRRRLLQLPAFLAFIGALPESSHATCSGCSHDS